MALLPFANASGGGSGSGTVTSVSVTTANGVSGTVANPTTTPAISLTLGNITPTSVNTIALTGVSTPSLTVTGTSSISGSNTGDQTITLTGDVTGSGTGSFATTLATVNANVGSFTNASVTVNAKGLITAVSSGTGVGDVTGPASSTNTAIARFNGTTGKVIQNSGVTIDGSNNVYTNNYLGSATATASAGGTTILTASSTRLQSLTGSSSQTYQLPDATTLTLGPWFTFNNNSSGSLIIQNNGGSTLYTVPAGGIVTCGPTSIGTANGAWDFHGYYPGTVTWGSGTTGLVFNTALTTTPSISAGISSASNPSFIPQRGSSTTGYGGDSTHLYGSIGGVATFTSTSSTFSIASGSQYQINGTQIAASNLSNGTTGSGSIVLATSPTLVTPTLGVATATSINKVAITAPATSATLTIANGKVLTVSNSLTFAGTDSTTMTFPSSSDTVVTLGATQTLTNKTLTSPVISTITNTGTLTLPTSTDTLVGRATTDTLTNKTLTTPTIAQINNSSAPGVKIQTNIQTDNSNSISNTTQSGVFFQYGWGQAVGNGSSDTLTDAVTFGTAFTTVLGVMPGLLSVVTGGSPASTITGLNIDYSTAGTSYSASAGSITTSGFNMVLHRSSGAFGSTTYYGYSWTAWGI